MDAFSNEKISLRPFLEFVRHAASSIEYNDLIDFVIRYAERLPASKRRHFMDTLSNYSKTKSIPVIKPDIFDEISALGDDIRKRTESIEDGTFYDESDSWDYYNDDDPDPLSKEQREEIERIFGEADKLFVGGNLLEAGKIYKELFSILSAEEVFFNPYDHYIYVEHRETRARYLRCIYETSAPQERVKRILEAMEITASMNDTGFNIYGNNYPLFIDIKNARLGELPDESDFLDSWIGKLDKLNTDRANILLLEAAYLKDGIEGVKSLSRQWKGRQPRGYLFWMGIKVEEENWDEVKAIAREALSEVHESGLRGAIAKGLSNAGEKANDKKAVLEGKRELFRSDPDEENLMNLIKEAKKQNARISEIDCVLDFLKSPEGKRAESTKELMTKALLMKGELETVYEKRGKTASLGWSYGDGSSAVLFAGILAALSMDWINDAETIKSILRRYTEIHKYGMTGNPDENVDGSLYDEILIGLKGQSIPVERQTIYMKWAEKIGRKRIEGIVDGKHRKAYERAAEVLCGLSECFVLRGKREKGFDLINEYRDGKYSRFPAFRREVNSVIKKSKVLK